MERAEEEREFRLRPRKPRLGRSERAGWSSGFRLLMHYARSTKKTNQRGAHAPKIRTPRRPHQQRCAARVTYLKNGKQGQWKAHGRYLARENAAHTNDGSGVGFTREGEAVDISSRLDKWQRTGDQRLWKLIVSPEFGERVDLTRLTRDLMARMAADLATDLEWVAVEHYNTEHPHVHIVLRGLRNDADAFRMSRQYVQQGIRSIAEDLCTRQLGYRTQLDAVEAERREITEKRLTSIDRRIAKDSSEIVSSNGHHYFALIRNPVPVSSNETERLRGQHEAARLAVLQRMGLAESNGAGIWLVRPDFEQILRAMQRAADRQKTLAAHGALLSDDRLPTEVLDPFPRSAVEGRVLVHGQEEQSGRNYLMLESTQAKVYFVPYTTEIEKARSRGELRVNSFIRIRNLSATGTVVWEVQDFGDAEGLIGKSQYFNNTARRLQNSGIVPIEDGWGGWLGRYQAALADAGRHLAKLQPTTALKQERKRPRQRSFGR